MKIGDKVSLEQIDYNSYYIDDNQTLVVEEIKEFSKLTLLIAKNLEEYTLFSLSNEHLDNLIKQLNDEKIRRLNLGIYYGNNSF